mgnify:CR=1 FL=1
MHKVKNEKAVNVFHISGNSTYKNSKKGSRLNSLMILKV